MKSWQDIGNTDTFQIQWFQSGTKCGFIRTRIRSHENKKNIFARKFDENSDIEALQAIYKNNNFEYTK